MVFHGFLKVKKQSKWKSFEVQVVTWIEQLFFIELIYFYFIRLYLGNQMLIEVFTLD